MTDDLSVYLYLYFILTIRHTLCHESWHLVFNDDLMILEPRFYYKDNTCKYCTVIQSTVQYCYGLEAVSLFPHWGIETQRDSDTQGVGDYAQLILIPLCPSSQMCWIVCNVWCTELPCAPTPCTPSSWPPPPGFRGSRERRSARWLEWKF